VVNAALGRFNPGRDPVPTAQEDDWASGPVWTDRENLVATEGRTPDSPALSESLYQLSCPGPRRIKVKTIMTVKEKRFSSRCLITVLLQ